MGAPSSAERRRVLVDVDLDRILTEAAPLAARPAKVDTVGDGMSAIAAMEDKP